MREKRWLWLGLLVFLFPLSLLSGRFCSFALTDWAYHGYLTLHLFLPQALSLVAIVSVAMVIVRVKLVGNRLDVLKTLASEVPSDIRSAFEFEAARLHVRMPEIVYVSAALPICFTGFDVRRPQIYVSRGFTNDLDAIELRLVAHHELVHVRDRHATWNFLWHAFFAALVLPGFAGCERALRYRRELRANVSASSIDPPLYERLLTRRARERRSLCFEGRAEPQPSLFISSIAPLATIAVILALFVSHADFMHDLPYLATHHC